MLEFHKSGVPTFDYGNNIRQMAKDEGVADAFRFPGFVPAYIRPLFCRGIGPFRWVALSGDPEDIYRTDEKVKALLPDDKHLHAWLDLAREKIKFQGLPARICWVGLGDRHRLGLAFNEMVAEWRAESADRDRPRPSRLRLGRLAQPRNRSDARWFRRRVGLADLECASQLRIGRDMGVVSSRRGCRDGILSARGHGDRGRRQPRGRPPARARALERSGDRRHAPRRRGIHGGRRVRGGKGVGLAGDFGSQKQCVSHL